MLPVGTNVRMSEVGKNTYVDGMYNPHNSFGVVMSDGRPFYQIYRVRWASGKSNAYNVDEIEPAGPIKLEDLI